MDQVKETWLMTALSAVLLVAAIELEATAGPLFEITQPFGVTNFPTSLAVSGNLGIIGGDGPFITFTRVGPGSALIYDVTTGMRTHTLTVPNDEDNTRSNFGSAVAIDGNLAAVGSPSEDRVGAAYLFNATTGEQLFRFTAETPELRGNFGRSISIKNDWVLVGSVNNDEDGLATLFQVSTGALLRTLTPADDPYQAGFGSSVAVAGNYAVVGAPYDSHAGYGSGSAYVFDLTTGAQLHKLTASDARSEAYFGTQVAIDGTRLVISASKLDGFQKEAGVYVFDLVTGAQALHIEDTQTPHIESNGSENYPRFGTSLALVGDRLLVGAPDNSESVESGGAAFVYDVNTGAEVMRFSQPSPQPFDWFGYSVAMTDRVVLIDASREGPPGSAFVFAMVPEPSSSLGLIFGLGSIALRRGGRRFV
jgi:outer membrane protein assembly factor BamB